VFVFREKEWSGMLGLAEERDKMEWAVGCWDWRRKFQIWRGEKENGVSHGVLGSAGKRDRWRGESENGVGCGLWRRWDRRRGRPAEESGERERDLKVLL
jgi:hypothetical protein